MSSFKLWRRWKVTLCVFVNRWRHWCASWVVHNIAPLITSRLLLLHLPPHCPASTRATVATVPITAATSGIIHASTPKRSPLRAISVRTVAVLKAMLQSTPSWSMALEQHMPLQMIAAFLAGSSHWLLLDTNEHTLSTALQLPDTNLY